MRRQMNYCVAPNKFSFKALIQGSIHPERLTRQMKAGTATGAALRDHFVAGCQSLLYEVSADESGAAGNEKFHGQNGESKSANAGWVRSRTDTKGLSTPQSSPKEFQRMPASFSGAYSVVTL